MGMEEELGRGNIKRVNNNNYMMGNQIPNSNSSNNLNLNQFRQENSGYNGDKPGQYRTNNPPANYNNYGGGNNYGGNNYNPSHNMGNNYSNNNNGSGINYQSNYQQQQQFQYRQPQAQKLIIPEDWNGMADFMLNTQDPELRGRVEQKLHEKLLSEENDLIGCHSESLRSALDVTKAEMSLISSLEQNRDAVSTREYLSILQDSIDEKMSLLEMLKEK